MNALILTAMLACDGGPDEPATPAPEPGELMVGTARVRNPGPVGIGTVGFRSFGLGAEPSPFAEIYPATTGVHDHPDFRAIAISRGEGFELVFLRADTVGMFQQLRRAVVLELEARTGRNLDHALVIGSTHTHSGPGRVIAAGGLFDQIADRFFPEHYERTIHAMADVVELALDDLKPGRVGVAWASAPDAINDRRCEDGLYYENGTIPLVVVEQEGQLAAIQMAYAIHGTVFNQDRLLLSEDVSGGIEQAVQNRFDLPVHVQMFNSWGADMSPGDGESVEQQVGAEQPPGFDRVERVGYVVADAVEEAMSAVEWLEDPEIEMATWRVPIDREHIGYGPGEFEFDYGGVYCGVSESLLNCDGDNHFDLLDEACFFFSEDSPAPNQTEISAGRLGDLYFVTFPGEPGTLLAEQIMGDIQDAHPEVEQLAFFGYSQDYLGYSILEDDWWNGGYEAAGALWGPRQGEYLAAKSVEAFDWTFGSSAPAEQPAPIAVFEVPDYPPRAATPAEQVGTVLVDVPTDVTWTDTVTFEIAGTDPWLGPPVATLVDAAGDPVLRPGGQPIDSDGQAFSYELLPDPLYSDAPDAPSRTFRWIFRMPVRHVTPTGLPDLEGTYQIKVSIPLEDGTLHTAMTSPFNVSAP